MDLIQIALDDQWIYFFAEDPRDDYSQVGVDVMGWIPLATLSDWAVTSSGQRGADWFRRIITLETTDFCVNYILHINNTPQTIAVFLNGQFIAEVLDGESFKGDVTDYIALGENVLAMKLTCIPNGSGGCFGAIFLQPVACE